MLFNKKFNNWRFTSMAVLPEDGGGNLPVSAELDNTLKIKY
jgi:hypothetical protein